MSEVSLRRRARDRGPGKPAAQGDPRAHRLAGARRCRHGVGIAVGALLAEDLSGTEALAGVGTTAQVLGTALLTIPVARATAVRGRRVGLRLGLGVAFVGAAVVLAAAVLRSFPLFVVGMFLFGGGTTANNQEQVCRRRPRRAGAPRS